jgi:hypothetical protein
MLVLTHRATPRLYHSMTIGLVVTDATTRVRSVHALRRAFRTLSRARSDASRRITPLEIGAGCRTVG